MEQDVSRDIHDAVAHLRLAIDLDPRMDPAVRELLTLAIVRLEDARSRVT